MTRTAGELMDATTTRLAADPDANPLLPLIVSGTAGLGTLAVLAREQRLVIAADLRSFRHLAERSAHEEPDSAPFFAMLAEGEAEALGAFAEACGVDEERTAVRTSRCRAVRRTARLASAPPASRGR